MNVELLDVDAQTQGSFIRCLHDERPQDPRVTELRTEWFEANRARGLRAKVLRRDDGALLGLCQYLPIEQSPFLGSGMMAILCIWVHGYEHLVGNQQKQGWGRFLLAAIEADARDSGMLGVTSWGKDFPYWNPVSFYEHMGYERADQIGLNVLVWKPFSSAAASPRLRRLRNVPVAHGGKVAVTVLLNGWCGGGCSTCVIARDAVKGIEDMVEFREIHVRTPEKMEHYGASFDCVCLDGNPFRKDGPPFEADELRAAITDLAARKRGDHSCLR